PAFDALAAVLAIAGTTRPLCVVVPGAVAHRAWCSASRAAQGNRAVKRDGRHALDAGPRRPRPRGRRWRPSPFRGRAYAAVRRADRKEHAVVPLYTTGASR